MSDPAATPAGPPGVDSPPPRELPRNALPIAVAVLLGAAGLVVVALRLGGLADAESFLRLGQAAILGVAASLLWCVVERARERASAMASPWAWIAFPLALLLFFGQMPLIALAVYPPIREFFVPVPHARAYYVRRPDGTRLEIDFPRDVRPGGQNLRLDAALVPPELFRSRPELFEWRGPRTLSLAIEPLETALGIEPVRTVYVNSDSHVAGSRPFLYAGGERAQAVSIEVEAPELRDRPPRRPAQP